MFHIKTYNQRIFLLKLTDLMNATTAKANAANAITIIRVARPILQKFVNDRFLDALSFKFSEENHLPNSQFPLKLFIYTKNQLNQLISWLSNSTNLLGCRLGRRQGSCKELAVIELSNSSSKNNPLFQRGNSCR